MALVHFLGEELDEYISGYREQIISFGAGVSITYIFVLLLPEFHRIVSESSELIFAFPLIGFTSIHMIEKYIAKSDFSSEKVRKEYSEIHSLVLFSYHGAIGYLIASLSSQDLISGALFILPLIIHIGVSSFSLSELHQSLAKRIESKIMISSAPLLGVTLFYTDLISESLFNPIFGTIIGIIFYVAIRDSIPQGREGRPNEYLLGTLIYLVIIIAARLLR
jgi:hypothetical protein